MQRAVAAGLLLTVLSACTGSDNQAVNDAPTINTDQVPRVLDARQRVDVMLFADDPDGDGVTLAVESNRFITPVVSGGNLRLTAADVADVTQVNLVIIAADRLGRVAREIVRLTIHPLTESGRGRTLLGRIRGAGMHLVILGDGYREDQQTMFREQALQVIDSMRADPGIAAHLAAWNIHMIETVSVDSGIDDNVEIDLRDTAFDSGYNCLGIQRLICGDNLAMFETALVEYPDLKQLALLVNDSRFGGSGGSVAIAAANVPQILLHEMGHSIAGLADEYVDSLISDIVSIEYIEGQFANVSWFSDPDLVPWRIWIDPEQPVPTMEGQPGVGVFQGAYYDAESFYRSSSNSRMRSYEMPFGPVNSEQWALSVYANTNPILGLSPFGSRIELAAGESQRFSVTPLLNETVQQVEWWLDGVLVANDQNANAVILSPSAGLHQLQLIIRDISGLIRQTPPHAGVFKRDWEIVVR